MQRYARSAQEGILVEIPHNLSDVLTKRIQSTFHTASELAHTLKGTTARKVFQCFPEIKKQLWGGAFWSRSYYVGSVGDMSVDTVLKYIESGQE
jgi:putative transposase